jgi:3-dehydroquinate synthase
MKTILAKTALRKYSIFIRKNIIDDASDIIKKHFDRAEKIVLITNNTIEDLYADKIESICRGTGLDHEIIALKDGEKYKNLKSVEFVYSRLIKNNIHRSDIMIAFGGGVIGDLGGYIASTFHRGIKLIQIPTTVMAQVDSSIGGKTVVNYKGIKNVIGSFYQPHMIFTDPLILATLEEKQIINGLGEILKYGLLFDKKILNWLKNNIDKKDPDRLLKLVSLEDFEVIIHKCASIKAKVVEKDEFDGDYRNLLNFGHTIGHAIENAGGFKKINHGQAVGMGMMAALEISKNIGYLDESEFEEIKDIYITLKLPFKIPLLDTDKLLDTLKYDKKFTGSSRRFILLKKINQPVTCDNIEKEIIVKSINNCINN